MITVIEWHNDDCVASSITHHGSYVKTKAIGDFHATQNGDVWDETIHTSSAEIKGYSTQYIITCRWMPSSIENITWGILGVSLKCHTDES